MSPISPVFNTEVTVILTLDHRSFYSSTTLGVTSLQIEVVVVMDMIISMSSTKMSILSKKKIISLFLKSFFSSKI